nr:MAG TPA: hypothetical protein [Caudoviricetes sp.]
MHSLTYVNFPIHLICYLVNNSIHLYIAKFQNLSPLKYIIR